MLIDSSRLQSGVHLRAYFLRILPNDDGTFHVPSLAYAGPDSPRHFSGVDYTYTVDTIGNDHLAELYAAPDYSGDTYDATGDALGILLTSNDPLSHVVTFRRDLTMRGDDYVTCLDLTIYYVE